MIDAALLSQIEDASLNACAPPEQLWIDGWLVRLSNGKARRGRCIHALAPGRLPLAERLQRCQALYDAAGLPMVFRITPYTQPATLDDALAGCGYSPVGVTDVMVCQRMPSPAALPGGLQRMQLAAEAFAAAVGALRGSSKDQCAAHARRMMLSPVPVDGWAIRESSGAALAVAQVTREGALVGLYDVHTADHARRRGLATNLCQHLLSLQAKHGANVAYLQVESDNSAAQRIYRRLGFQDGYRYHDRQRA